MWFFFFFFFKQKTAYEMRISDWSSDVCSSDLRGVDLAQHLVQLGDGAAADERHPPRQRPAKRAQQAAQFAVYADRVGPLDKLNQRSIEIDEKTDLHHKPGRPQRQSERNPSRFTSPFFVH